MLKNVTHSKLFIKTFLLYIFVLIVPIFIFSLLSYYYDTQKIKNSTIIKCNEEAQNVTSVIDDQLADIQTLSGRINMLSWVWRLTAETDIFDSEFTQIRKKEIIDDLKIFMNDNGIIDNMILLFPKKNAAISMNGWFDIDTYIRFLADEGNMLDLFEIDELKESLNKEYDFALPFSDKLIIKNIPVIWLAHSIDNVSEPRAQAVFTIDQSRLNRFIKSIASETLDSLIIYSKEGIPVIKYQNTRKPLSDHALPISITSQAFGWKYEMIYDASTQEAGQNEFLFLIITLLIALVLAPAAAYYLAYLSYSPLKNMMSRIMTDSNAESSQKSRVNEYNILENAFSQLKNDNKQMERRVREYSRYTQNDMLVRLLKGYFYHSEHEDLSYYGIDYSEKNSFAVLVIGVTENGIKKDDQLQKIMMAGLLVEKMLENEKLHYKIIDILEEDIVVILSDFNGTLDNIDITQLTDNLQNALKDIEGTETHICGGKIEQGILGISKSYHNAKESGNMSNFAQNMHDRIDISKTFYYPTDWEIQLINNLKMGKEEPASNILDEIRLENDKRMLAADTQEALYKSINNTIVRVAIELNMDWLEKEVENNIGQYLENHDNSTRTATKQWSYIYGTCHMICIRTTYQKQENNDISNKIMDYINEYYTDTSLSLKEIAQEVGVSQSAASKAFKNAHGINFYDYTCRLRMEKAKELLKNSEMSVKAICKEVGYENEFSLRRTFLRYEGISISEYRNSQQSKRL